MSRNVETISDCKTAFDKAKRLIAERKKRFNRIPEIQEFDNGNILIQYFEHWDMYWDKLKKRNFEPIQQDHKSIFAIYAEAGKTIEVEDTSKSKTYMIINGELEITINDTKQKILSFQSISIPQNLNHTVDVIRDTYVIIVND